MNEQYFPLSNPAPTPAQPVRLELTRYILLVDNDDFTRQSTSDALSRLGYQVDAVANAALAWQYLQSIEYDLLITKNSMPQTTGVELLKMLSSAGRNQPAILLTEAGSNVESTASRWSDPAIILSAPCSAMELAAAVKGVLIANEGAISKILGKRYLNTSTQRALRRVVSPRHCRTSFALPARQEVPV